MTTTTHETSCNETHPSDGHVDGVLLGAAEVVDVLGDVQPDLVADAHVGGVALLPFDLQVRGRNLSAADNFC